MNTSQFRYLLTASLILALAAGFFDLIFPSAVPESLLQAQETIDVNLSTPVLIFFTLVVFIGLTGYIAAVIGLYRFRPWAPHVAVLATALLILVTPALGVSVSSGWASALTELSSTLWGAVLAVIYFSSIKEKFIATRAENQENSLEKPAAKKLAHPGKRFQGQFLDGLIICFLGFASFYILDMFLARELAVYSGMAIGASYFLLSDSLPNGQSIGKRLLKIQVLNKESMKPCSLFQSFLRNVTFPLGIFDWAPIFFGSNRRLGDFIASTIVVNVMEDSLTLSSSETPNGIS